ncbi:MAG: ABC transporter substrate-binding protein [Oscillospiraceae bacterium]|jgi:NitT/TauT family transport system substrate-binding protein|nr:ABC transporter substrate-binding protein [Oscillospiraceae bacterium]
MTNTRKFAKQALTLALALLMLTLAAAQACAEAAPTEDDPLHGEEHYTVKVLYGTGLCGVPFHVAKQLGFFEAEGLVEDVDYTFFKSDSAQNELFATGNLDVGNGLLASKLAPLDNGLEIKTVAGLHTGCLQILGRADGGINTVEDLRGKRIGVSALATSAHIISQRVLANAGIGVTTDNSEVEFVVFTASELPLVLENGAVDAIVTEDPTATTLIVDGVATSIYNYGVSEYLKDEYCCTLWVAAEALEKYPYQIGRVVNALLKASAWVDANRHLAIDIQMENGWNPNGAEGKREYAYASIDNFKYLPSVSGARDALYRNITEMQELGLVKPETDAEALAEYAFFALPNVPDTYIGTEIVPPLDPYQFVSEK